MHKAASKPSNGPNGHSLLRALRSRNYRLYFFGQGLSLIGTWMTYLATGWLVYRLTHSAVLLGVVGFCGQIPAFLLSPLGGVLVDRLSRHRVLVITQVLAMVQSLALAFLALTHQITVQHIIVLSIFQGLINAFDIPARQAFVVEMVELEDLGNAIALNSSIFNGARLIGPSIAGMMIAVTGEGVCFLIDGLSYLAVIAAFCAMRSMRPKAVSTQPKPILKELKEGFAYAFGFVPIRVLLGLLALVSLVGIPYTILMPIFAREILHGAAYTLGFLMGASGLGALAGGLYLASRRSVVGLGKLIVFATGLFGVGLIAFSASRWLWLSLLLMLLVGFGMLVQMAASNTIIQTIVEEDKRGRVMSFYAMVFMGMTPFGSLLAGSLASKIGAPTTTFIGGLGCLAAAVGFAWYLPRLRAIIRPIYIQKGILPQVAEGLQATVNLLVPPEE